MSQKGEITTLGRGGSDTSAVGLAVGLGSGCVEFYKDVPGIFEENPKVYPQAKVYPQLSYAQALQIAERGAEVLHKRCIELAAKNKVQLCIHSFNEPTKVGTVVGVKESASSKCYEVETCSLT